MRKQWIIVTVMIVLLFVACSKEQTIVSTSNEETSTFSGTKGSQVEEPSESISVRNLEQLNEMREMVKCEDDEKLYQYLRSIEGGGADTREDLEVFLELIDSLSIINLLDGTVTWISQQGGDLNTGEHCNVVYITYTASDGNWVRLEYFLSVNDISAEIERRKKEHGLIEYMLASPVCNKDRKVKIYSELRKKHVSGEGYVTEWVANIDGIFTKIVLYSNEKEQITPEERFKDIRLSTILKSK